MRNFITKNKSIKQLFIFALWVGIWQIIYLVVNKEILVVSPFGVAARIFSLIGKTDFWKTVLYSLLRIMSGYVIALTAGIIMAVISAKFKFVYDIFYPLLAVIKATPVASFIILALVFFKTDNVPVFTTFLMVLPIIWVNVYEGIINTDRGLLEVAGIYNFDSKKRLRLIYYPSVRPYFAAAVGMAVGLAWKAGIAAEVICTPKFSVGKQIYNSKIYLETLDLFSWTAVVIALSVLIEKLVTSFINRGSSKSHNP